MGAKSRSPHNPRTAPPINCLFESFSELHIWGDLSSTLETLEHTPKSPKSAWVRRVGNTRVRANFTNHFASFLQNCLSREFEQCCGNFALRLVISSCERVCEFARAPFSRSFCVRIPPTCRKVELNDPVPSLPPISKGSPVSRARFAFRTLMGSQFSDIGG